MAHIFKHKETGNLYKLSHLIKDLRFLNGGGFEGIYASPINEGEQITHTRDDCRRKRTVSFDPDKFVKDNFEIVREIW